VTFDISADGIIRVTSIDKATKMKQSITINMSGGLSEADIERMKLEAEANAASDASAKERSQYAVHELVNVFIIVSFCSFV
jgi:molecular chaperone DnaK